MVWFGEGEFGLMWGEDSGVVVVKVWLCCVGGIFRLNNEVNFIVGVGCEGECWKGQGTYVLFGCFPASHKLHVLFGA